MKKLTIKTIKELSYTRSPKINPATGKASYPKQILWDEQLTGFGVRVFPSGKKSFVYQYWTKTKEKRLMTLGAVNEISLENARDAALRHAPLVKIDGADPLEERQRERNGILVSDFCKIYMERHAKPMKKSWREDQRRIDLYISKYLGTKQVQNIKRQDVAELMHRIGTQNCGTSNCAKNRKGNKCQGHPIMANRVKENLSKMFDLAERWGYVDETLRNPARGIDEFPESERTEYVKPEYMPLLAEAIEQEKNQVGKLAIWMYLLTAKRKNELLEAKWSDFDEAACTLKIAPSGRETNKVRTTKNDEIEFLPLDEEALAILERLKAERIVGNPYIFPGKKPGSHLVNIRKIWERIKLVAQQRGADLEGVTIHGLRHTVAVWLANYDDSDTQLIAKVLNQKSLLATKRYAKYKISSVKQALQRHGALVKKHAKTNLGQVKPLKKTNRK